MPHIDIRDCLGIAHSLADAAKPIALQHFRAAGLQSQSKSDAGAGYDPVTLADRGIEAEMRRILAAERPQDGILGEEFSGVETKNGLTWVLDPIDGTRAFICGLPCWGVLIALNDGDGPVLGIMDQPFTGERFVGIDLEGQRSATLHSQGTQRPLVTGDTTDLSTALLCATAPDMFSENRQKTAFDNLGKRVRLIRYGTDCYGYAMLAAGQVDLVVEASLKPYDVQALMPLVRAAGGVMTDWQGNDCQHGGEVVAAATEALHEAALSALNTP